MHPAQQHHHHQGHHQHPPHGLDITRPGAKTGLATGAVITLAMANPVAAPFILAGGAVVGTALLIRRARSKRE